MPTVSATRTSSGQHHHQQQQQEQWCQPQPPLNQRASLFPREWIEAVTKAGDGEVVAMPAAVVVPEELMMLGHLTYPSFDETEVPDTLLRVALEAYPIDLSVLGPIPWSSEDTQVPTSSLTAYLHLLSEHEVAQDRREFLAQFKNIVHTEEKHTRHLKRQPVLDALQALFPHAKVLHLPGSESSGGCNPPQHVQDMLSDHARADQDATAHEDLACEMSHLHAVSTATPPHMRQELSSTIATSSTVFSRTVVASSNLDDPKESNPASDGHSDQRSVQDENGHIPHISTASATLPQPQTPVSHTPPPSTAKTGNLRATGAEPCASIDAPIAIITSMTHVFVLYKFRRYTLRDLLAYSPGRVASADTHCYIVNQIVEAVSALHLRACFVADLSLETIYINEAHHVHVHVRPQLQDPLESEHSGCDGDGSSDARITLQAQTRAWERGNLSNFDYLMYLNKVSGRRRHDPHHHFFLPWVSDFEEREHSRRDLTVTKYRLNKGDIHLDLCFQSATPHHVSEWLSELAYFLYKARTTPQSILCKYVRSRWEPNEYPLSMMRLYQFTPDEAVPEFYSETRLFQSMHADMADLTLPEWAEQSSYEDFVRWHMALLNDTTTARQLHHWIDLCFGYKLGGDAAVAAKNVHLDMTIGTGSVPTPLAIPLKNTGLAPLFSHPHPTLNMSGSAEVDLDDLNSMLMAWGHGNGCIDGDDDKPSSLSEPANVATNNNNSSCEGFTFASHPHYDAVSLAVIIAQISCPTAIPLFPVYGASHHQRILPLRTDALQCMHQITPSLQPFVDASLRLQSDYVLTPDLLTNRIYDKGAVFPLLQIPKCVQQAQRMATLLLGFEDLSTHDYDKRMNELARKLTNLATSTLKLLGPCIEHVCAKAPKTHALGTFVHTFVALLHKTDDEDALHCLRTFLKETKEALYLSLDAEFVCKLFLLKDKRIEALLSARIELAMKSNSTLDVMYIMQHLTQPYATTAPGIDSVIPPLHVSLPSNAIVILLKSVLNCIAVPGNDVSKILAQFANINPVMVAIILQMLRNILFTRAQTFQVVLTVVQSVSRILGACENILAVPLDVARYVRNIVHDSIFFLAGAHLAAEDVDTLQKYLCSLALVLACHVWRRTDTLDIYPSITELMVPFLYMREFPGLYPVGEGRKAGSNDGSLPNGRDGLDGKASANQQSAQHANGTTASSIPAHLGLFNPMIGAALFLRLTQVLGKSSMSANMDPDIYAKCEEMLYAYLNLPETDQIAQVLMGIANALCPARLSQTGSDPSATLPHRSNDRAQNKASMHAQWPRLTEDARFWHTCTVLRWQRAGVYVPASAEKIAAKAKLRYSSKGGLFDLLATAAERLIGTLARRNAQELEETTGKGLISTTQTQVAEAAALNHSIQQRAPGMDASYHFPAVDVLAKGVLQSPPHIPITAESGSSSRDSSGHGSLLSSAHAATTSSLFPSNKARKHRQQEEATRRTLLQQLWLTSDTNVDATQVKARTIRGHTSRISALKPLGDWGSHVISGSRDKTVRIWSVVDGLGSTPSTGKQQGGKPGHSKAHLAEDALLYPMHTGGQQLEYREHTRGVTGVECFGEDIVASIDAQFLHLWSPRSGQLDRKLNFDKVGLTCLTRLSGHNTVVLGHANDTVSIVDMRSQEVAHQWYALPSPPGVGDTCAIRSLCVTQRDEHAFYAGASNGIISEIDSRMGLILRSWAVHGDEISLLHSASPTMLFSFSERACTVHDLSSTSATAAYRSFLTGDATVLSLASPDPHTLVAVNGNSKLQLIQVPSTLDNAPDSTFVRPPSFRGIQPTSIAMACDEAVMVVGCDSGTLRILPPYSHETAQ